MADYRDYLRAKRIERPIIEAPRQRLPGERVEICHTVKRPGDLVFTGNRVVRVERSVA